MPSGYQVALFIHVLAAVAAGGIITAFIVSIAIMRRAESVQLLRPWATTAAMIDRLFPVAAIVLLLAGSYLASSFEDTSTSVWDQGWVYISALALLLMIVADLFVNNRKATAINNAAREAPDGPIPPWLAAQLTDPVLFGTAHATALTLVGVIWNMTTRPDTAVAVIAVLVAAAVGAASAAPMIARQQRIIEHAGRGEHHTA